MFTDQEYEQMACISIRNYLKSKITDIEIKSKYPLALKRLIENSKKLDRTKTVGVISMTQGPRSTTYENGVEAMSITRDIALLLPNPKKFRAW
ncbi:MAG: hypothetical protein ACRDA4_10555 [Filifactoraceae bacterium]